MQLSIGDTWTVTREVTDELVRSFAIISGDMNPIHLDEEFASKTRFGQRIAHGMLSGAFISSLLGNELAELKIVYLSQTMKFIAPVFVGDTVTVRGTITNIRTDKPVITLKTVCSNQRGSETMTGEAVVMLL